MKNSKLYIAGTLAIALALAPALFIQAQAIDSVTAIGSAGGPAFVYSGQPVKARVGDGANAIDVYVVPGTAFLTNAAAVGAAPVFPGVPNTGGMVNNASGSFTSDASFTSGGNFTGGSFVPGLGFVPNTGTGGFPNVPNTGGSFVPGLGFVAGTSVSANAAGNFGTFLSPNGTPVAIDANGQLQITGIVSTVTPEAIAVISGTQTWTVRWNSGTAMIGATGQAFTAGQFQQGDVVQVNGFIDQLYVSQIDATSIRTLSR